MGGVGKVRAVGGATVTGHSHGPAALVHDGDGYLDVLGTSGSLVVRAGVAVIVGSACGVRVLSGA